MKVVGGQVMKVVALFMWIEHYQPHLHQCAIIKCPQVKSAKNSANEMQKINFLDSCCEEVFVQKTDQLKSRNQKRIPGIPYKLHSKLATIDTVDKTQQCCILMWYVLEKDNTNCIFWWLNNS